jgi:glycerate kinase
MNVVIAPDKFKNSASAKEVAQMIYAALPDEFTKHVLPQADGGEGTLEILSRGKHRLATVTGTLGEPIQVPWYFQNNTAVFEVANICGMPKSGHNDPLLATTKGVGELINVAASCGCIRFIIGIGGTATTDGGLMAVRAISSRFLNRGLDVSLLCDVRAKFLEAAKLFSGQKGASASEREFLERRLEAVAKIYDEEFRIDVTSVERTGAGGGLSGGLYAALGAELLDGAQYVADITKLSRYIETADFVITGEGKLDSQSFNGKVVGNILEICNRLRKSVVVIAGKVDYETISSKNAIIISLESLFGAEKSMAKLADCIADVLAKRPWEKYL